MRIEKILIDSQLEQIGEYSYYTDMVEPGFHEFVTDVSDEQFILTCDMNEGEIKAVYVDTYDAFGQECTNDTLNEVEVINTFKVNFNNQLEKLYHKKFEDIDEDEERLMALEAKGDELTDLKKLRVWF